MNKTITIPKQLYIGTAVFGTADTINRAYLTEYSSNPKLSNSISIIKSYSKTPPVIMENTPISGFSISRNARSLGWNSSNSTIRIEDPRGFDYDVPAYNLIMLLDNNTIHNGEILTECVWGRDGNDMLILPLNSAPYLNACENTTRFDSKVSTRDIKTGNMIEMRQNGSIGRYLGLVHLLKINNMFAYGSSYSNNLNVFPYLSKTAQKYHGILFKQKNQTIITFSTSLALSKIVENSTMSDEEAAKMVAEALFNSNKNHRTNIKFPNKHHSSSLVGITKSKDNPVIVGETRIPLSQQEIKIAFDKQKGYEISNLVFCEQDNNQYMVVNSSISVKLPINDYRKLTDSSITVLSKNKEQLQYNNPYRVELQLADGNTIYI